MNFDFWILNFGFWILDFAKRVERRFLNRNKGGVKNFGLDGEYGKKGSWFLVHVSRSGRRDVSLRCLKFTI